MRTTKHLFTEAEISSASSFLSKRKGIWIGRITYYTDKDGLRTRREISKTFPPDDVHTKTQANKALSSWHRDLIKEAQERKLAEEQAAHEIEHPTWTVPDYAEKVIQDYSRAAESTKSGYLTNLRRIRRAFGNKTLEELTADDVHKWHNHMQREGLSNTTIIHAHALLSQVMKAAVEDGLVTSNVCTRRAAKPPRREKKEHNILTASERGRLIDFLDSAEPSTINLATRIALETGMRIGEVCGLTWKCTDLDNGILRVRKSIGKTHSGRYLKDPKSEAAIRDIPISKALRSILRTQRNSMWTERQALVSTTREEFSELYVIGYIDGRYFNPDILGKQWNILCDILQLKGTQGKPTFHDLRHTAITVWIRENGIDPYTASKMAGHSSPAYTLSLYGNTDEEAMRRAAELAGATLEREARQAQRDREEQESQYGHVFDLLTGTEG